MPKATKKLLSVSHLSVRFDKQLAVDDLSFDIYENEIVGLVGESGSGKTVSALAAMQLLPDNATVSENSRIIYQDKDLLDQSEKNMRAIRGSEISIIFQDAMTAFNPVFTIGNQIIESIRSHHRCRKKIALQEARHLLDEVGIKDPDQCLKSYPHQLSGGMLQRAMIAMALASKPRLLIADEPTTALDVTIQAQVIDLIKEIKAKHASDGMGVLFISHDLGLVSQLCDRVIVLKEGIKVEQNTCREFFANPQHDYSRQLLASLPSLTPKLTATHDTPTLLETDNLSVYFPIRRGALRLKQGDVKAVDGVNLKVPKGETLALVGESGSGKSTTAYAILRLLNITSGQILYNKTPLQNLSQHKYHPYRRDIQIIFQDPYAALNPRRLIGDSIAEGILTQKIVRSKKEADELVDELLLKVELTPDMKYRYPHEFSGGQKQRICIARALGLKPKLLVLDEPTSALDVSIQAQILQLLIKLQQEHGMSYLLITHNLGVVAEMSHHIAVMYQGKIVEHGTTQAILNNPTHPYTKQLLAAIPKVGSDQT
ncbi:MAG: peptide ABC transporter ATP-binding protein [Coxiella sp. (in: Bacteria)]|nr:MAG: peptide ABC transporter ATP-binding protein [Coxiella sp. (in: g-proteobacteria)]